MDLDIYGIEIGRDGQWPSLRLFGVMSLAITYLSTPLGWLRLEGESMGLSRLDFVEGPSSDTINSESLQRAIEQLNEYFEGTRKEFKLYLSPSGTHFLKNV